MSVAFEELKGKLREIFQLDRNDLDFGLYRIMNLKSKEVTDFIDNDLLPQVKNELKRYSLNDNKTITEELKKAEEQAKELGMDPEDAPKVKELKEKLKDSFDSEKIENEIYSDLYNFFKRYYSEGDFLSLRRYKEGVYALPYEGEEVKLHWANADQYYIKSGENLTNYTFKIKDKKIRFEIINASTEQNNNKDDKNRRLKLVNEETGKIKLSDNEEDKVQISAVRLENNEYIISFSYLPDESKSKQEELNKQIYDTLLKEKLLLSITKDLSVLTGSETNKIPLLQKHLNNFTAKNTFDYFIHKDLGKFLNRELDFYIKNEIMHLDDIENESAPKVEKYLCKVKILRQIAKKIISFLASLENFQKKIWLKKKFVLETNYCITLDRISEDLYPEIINNEKQIKEWINLFAIDKIKGYKDKLDVQFLKDNPFLVLDTAFFDSSFKYKMLANIDNLDEQCDGLLIHSENFQALNLLQEKYKEKIKCIYIDPPYNTGKDGFVYKDGYNHSSWISMMSDRLKKVCQSMKDDGVIFISIDDNELDNLKKISDEIFGIDNFIGCLSVENNPKGRKNSDFISVSSEYNLIYARNKSKTYFIENIPKKASDMSLDGDGRFVHKSGKRVLVGENSFNNIVLNYESDKNYSVYFCAKHYDIKIRKENIGEIDDYLIQNGYVKYYSHYDNQLVENTYSIDKFQELFKNKALEFSSDKIYEKNFSDTIRIKSQLINKEYEAIVKGVKKKYSMELTTTGAGTQLKKLFGENKIVFSAPKNIGLLELLITLLDQKDNIVLDYFAGSGTTGHAVINLNRENEGKRKYILVEMGNYFDQVTKPRIEKVIYSEDWKDGKPISRKGSSHCFKYIRLESYEDALDNLSFNRSEEQTDLLSLPKNKGIKEDYILNYMMDLETKGSLLNIEKFNKPFDYELKITRNSETKTVKVNLPETFNYLIGLNVSHIHLTKDILCIEGTTTEGERTLVLWRDIEKTSSEDLDKWFEKQAYSTQDMEFDTIYVNGDNNLENLRKSDETWKVRLIEAEFQKRMFDVKDV